jgi:membrane associated rhomboid family serine protease
MRGQYHVNQNRQSSYHPTTVNDMYIKIIIVNTIIFLFANISINFFNLGDFFANYVALPLSTTAFGKFWTFLTYQFLHISFWHLFNNMIILWIFGRLAQLFFDKTTILSVYIIGGISAALLTLLFFNSGGVLLGASGSIYAIMVATAYYRPNYTINLFIFGPVKIKWIAIVLVVLGIVIDFKSNTAGKISHLGGGLFGLLYAYYRLRFRDILRPVTKLLSKIGVNKNINISKFKSTKDRLLTNNTKPIERDVPLQYRVDKILDKINKKGIKSLSKDERKILDEYHSKL